MSDEYALDRSERDTMRELTEREALRYYIEARCPFCYTPAPRFRRGPRGGMSINVECPTCLARLNVFDNVAGERWYCWGQLIRAPLANFTPWQ